jgi:hypothetical protein
VAGALVQPGGSRQIQGTQVLPARTGTQPNTGGWCAWCEELETTEACGAVVTPACIAELCMSISGCLLVVEEYSGRVRLVWSVSLCHSACREAATPSYCLHVPLRCIMQEGAGNALCHLLQASRGAQAASLEARLLDEMLLRAPDAHWARSRLASLQLQTGQYEQAVTSFQGAIR